MFQFSIKRMIEAVSTPIRAYWQKLMGRPAPAHAPDIPEKRKRKTKAEMQADDREDWQKTGSWFHLGDILDRLETYIESVKRLKKSDLDGYALYSKVGGRIISYDSLLEGSTERPCVPAWGVKGVERPSFGLVHVHFHESGEDGITPHLVYFTKKRRPSWVQPMAGDIYEVKCFYDGRDNNNKDFVKHGVIGRYYVCVDAEGFVTALREKELKTLATPREQRFGRNQTPFKRVEWDWPSFLRGWAEDNRHRCTDRTPENHGSFMFSIMANVTHNAANGFQVRAKRDGVTATFDVDMLRTAYFFKDRNKTITVNGRARKIVHIVRVHKRDTASGKATYVRSHLRGERRFDWHGYDVKITMPGLHHRPINEFTATNVEFEHGQTPKGWVDLEDTTKMIDETMSA